LSRNSAEAAETARIGAIETLLLGRPLRDAPGLLAGLLLAALVVLAALWVADYLNSSFGVNGVFSYIMAAIVIGLVIGNTIEIPAVFSPGIAFCPSKLLRLGIVMMGIRLSVFDVMRIGVWGIPIVLICITTGLVLTTYFTRLLRLPPRLGTLMAVGTSICGASAIIAAAPVIKANDEEVAYAVANITIFGSLALLIYPYLANFLFSGNVVMAGLFQGTAIHDTSQVTAAGLIYDQTFGVSAKPSAADIAIVIKLVRNVFMAAVIPLMAYLHVRGLSNEEAGSQLRSRPLSMFPLFIIGFVGMAAVRSAGDTGLHHGALALGVFAQPAWSQGTAFISDAAGYTLAMAMAGVGLGTRFKVLKGLGVKPFYVGLFASLVVGVASAVSVFLLGSLVQI